MSVAQLDAIIGENLRGDFVKFCIKLLNDLNLNRDDRE